MGPFLSLGCFLSTSTSWENRTHWLKIRFLRIKSLISQFFAYLTSQTSTFQIFRNIWHFSCWFNTNQWFFFFFFSLRKLILTQWKHDKKQHAARSLLMEWPPLSRHLGGPQKSIKQGEELNILCQGKLPLHLPFFLNMKKCCSDFLRCYGWHHY